MSISCPACAATKPDTAAFCPGCGRDMHPVERAHGMVGALPVTIAGALAYCTIIPAIIFLLVQPYSKNRFVRFHSFQCLGLWLAGVIIGASLRVVSSLLFFIPVLGRLFISLVILVVGLAFVAVWVVLVVKALRGEMFKLPIVGDFAERQTPPG